MSVGTIGGEIRNVADRHIRSQEPPNKVEAKYSEIKFSGYKTLDIFVVYYYWGYLHYFSGGLTIS